MNKLRPLSMPTLKTAPLSDHVCVTVRGIETSLIEGESGSTKLGLLYFALPCFRLGTRMEPFSHSLCLFFPFSPRFHVADVGTIVMPYKVLLIVTLWPTTVIFSGAKQIGTLKPPGWGCAVDRDQ